ncbi:B-box zinc finger protein 32 [Lycium barbarum]|uniref:B-box zinc finger protein 32 n=1 Tax=Lycium barbarum TaxID=112863 RepID=UPI00293E01F5|nr:B-box zinc finger protein 32 [Lycium barbarum]
MEVVCPKLCELCNDQAALFCPSDSAFLCFHCDAKVHQANFLVSRHLRVALCSHCNSLTKTPFFSGSHPTLCLSCSRNSSDDDSDLCSLSSSSSSTCISSTQSCATTQKNISSSDRKQNDFSGEVNSAVTACPKPNELARSRSTVKLRDPRMATGVFMHWCTKLGMYGEDSAVQTACGALEICFGRFRGLPVRVGMAACLWFGLRNNGDGLKSTQRFLKRLEEISGVPAKLILATELKLQKIVKVNNQRRRQGMEESWDEWSP